MRNGLMRNGVVSNNPAPKDLGSPVIRRLGLDDLNGCAELALDRSWWPEKGKWALLLAAADAWGVDAPDGKGLAGTVALTRWGASNAGLGMMLVAARFGGQGLGRLLMEYALREAGEDCAVSLFATDSGRPLYDKLGFQPVRRSVAFRGTFRAGSPANKARKREARAGAAPLPEPAGEVRPVTEADLQTILTLDRAAYGADRERMLSRLPGFAEQFLVFEGDAGIVGYAASWRTELYTVIGPLMAQDGAVARRLVTELAAHSVTQIRLDLDPDRPELPGWAHAHGLLPTERTVIMTHGGPAPRGVSGHLYTPISVAMC